MFEIFITIYRVHFYNQPTFSSSAVFEMEFMELVVHFFIQICWINSGYYPAGPQVPQLLIYILELVVHFFVQLCISATFMIIFLVQVIDKFTSQ